MLFIYNVFVILQPVLIIFFYFISVAFEVKLSDPFIVPELKLYIPDAVDYKKKESVKYNKKEGVRYRKKEGVCTLVVPYSIMRTEVFNSVIRSTLNLIEQQIKKVDGDVKRIYIVGGFASSPLLQKMIFRRFYVKRNLFPRTKFRMGSLVNLGLLAVMNGAIKYGTHDAKEAPRSDIVKNEFGYTTTDEYDVLICLDIGYETTSCSYKDLTKKSGKMIDITDWPGNEKSNVFIPTAKETINGETLWGARVQDPFNRDSKKLITPSKLMALVKADFRKYLCQYLQLVLNHVHATIGSLSDKSRYRYVITTENCYPFFTDKSEMRKIVERAGIISAEDSAHRLLLIGRDHASAMYFERKYFLESDACTHHFLQINMYHDTCYLSLFESIKINHAGYRSRNVRRLKSVTFDFDFIDRAVLRLNRYVTENTSKRDFFIF
ncbi:hypothetical protein EDC94DRAFT_107890 [Helicostylum pulchrum]|nr:hypothetical protein EDC94DRAFT_107890 [Helicostylum pulchrum]